MPDSQEIKTNASRFNSLVSESSSDSDTEKRSEESPINIYRKKKPVKITKQDLTKKFDAETLPVRVLTRVRKPTVKVQDNALGHKIVTNILTNRLIAANDEIDDDIISENIMRLKSKNDKTNHSININNTRSRSAINKPAAANENKEMKQETDKHKENKIKIKDNQRKNAIEKPVTKPRGRPRKQGSKVKDSKHTKGKDESTIIEPSDATGKINSLDSTSQSTKSTRGTRNKKEVGISKIEPSETSKSRGRKKHSEEKSKTTDNNDASSSDTKNEVRRSRRKAATDKEREKPKLKSILKNSVCKSIAHEQSTEYNVSSESNEESPNHLKRLADSDLEVPSPKRTRPSSANTSVRFLPSSMKSFRVLFTAFPFNEVRVKLEKLGATVVGDVTSCDVVVSRQVKRTVKFLCAVGLGKPLVGAQWVQACSDLGSLVDPWQYLIKDDENEKRFKFELQRTLSGERGYLAGYNVSATPNVEPRAPDMKMIVECSGGKWRASGPRWICITCLKDRALWDELRRRGARLVSCEFVLTGVLRQKLEIDLHRFPFCDACDTGHFVPPLCRYTRDQGNKKHSNKSGL